MMPQRGRSSSICKKKRKDLMRVYKKLGLDALPVLMAQTNLSFGVQILKNLMKMKKAIVHGRVRVMTLMNIWFVGKPEI